MPDPPPPPLLPPSSSTTTTTTTGVGSSSSSSSAQPMMSSLELDCLIYSYLQESGYSTTGKTLLQESNLSSNDSNTTVTAPRGHLIKLLQKGLLYCQAEKLYRNGNRDSKNSNQVKLIGSPIENELPLPRLPKKKQKIPTPPPPQSLEVPPVPSTSTSASIAPPLVISDTVKGKGKEQLVEAPAPPRPTNKLVNEKKRKSTTSSSSSTTTNTTNGSNRATGIVVEESDQELPEGKRSRITSNESINSNSNKKSTSSNSGKVVKSINNAVSSNGKGKGKEKGKERAEREETTTTGGGGGGGGGEDTNMKDDLSISTSAASTSKSSLPIPPAPAPPTISSSSSSSKPISSSSSRELPLPPPPPPPAPAPSSSTATTTSSSSSTSTNKRPLNSTSTSSSQPSSKRSSSPSISRKPTSSSTTTTTSQQPPLPPPPPPPPLPLPSTSLTSSSSQPQQSQSQQQPMKIRITTTTRNVTTTTTTTNSTANNNGSSNPVSPVTSRGPSNGGGEETSSSTNSKKLLKIKSEVGENESNEKEGKEKGGGKGFQKSGTGSGGKSSSSKQTTPEVANNEGGGGGKEKKKKLVAQAKEKEKEKEREREREKEKEKMKEKKQREQPVDLSKCKTIKGFSGGGEGVVRLKGHTVAMVQPCSFNSKVPTLLATGAGDSTCRIWDVPPPPSSGGVGLVEEHIICKHASAQRKVGVAAVAWNPSGSLLATGSEDGIARIWTPSGDLHLVLSMHQRAINSLRWSPSGTLLLTGSLDSTVCLWELSSGKVRQQYGTHGDSILDVDWNDDTTFASASMDKTVHLFTTGRNTPIHRLKGHRDEVNVVKFSPCGTLVATCSDDHTVRIWSLRNLPALASVTDKKSVRKGDEDRKIDREQDEDEDGAGGCLVLQGHTSEVHQISWKPGCGKEGTEKDGNRLIASCSFDQTAKLWDADEGTCLHTFSRHQDFVYSIAFEPTLGRFLATGSDDGTVMVWRLKDKALVLEYESPAPVYELTFNPPGTQIAVTGRLEQVAVIPFDPVASFNA